MKPEVKLIYTSMLTRNAYDAKPVQEYILKLVEKYRDIFDVEKSEFENIQMLLGAMIQNVHGSEGSIPVDAIEI